MIQLRDYQCDLIDECRVHYRAGRNRVALQSPTGSGKTIVFSFVTKSAVEKGLRVLILAHRSEILDQIERMLTNVGVGFLSMRAGSRTCHSAKVAVASIQTITRHFDDCFVPNLVIYDEVHHCVSSTGAKVFAQYPAARYLGVTATPERLDGRGLGEFFNALVLGPEVQWLIDNKFLARPIYYAPNVGPDMTGVSKVAGEFNRKQISALLDKGSITGDAVAHYKKLCPGRKAIAFCISLEHAEHVRAQFEAGGIRAAVIDGKLTPEDRRQRVADLQSGAVPVLVSCELVSEGFDLPSVGAAILLRPTASLGLHLQQLGRALRPKEDGSEAIILDHSGNCLRHGWAEDERDWSLDGHSANKRKAAASTMHRCKGCFVLFRGDVCPQCQLAREVQSREIKVTAGELVRMTPGEADRAAIADRHRKQRMFQQLKFVEKQKGYKSGWARHVFESKLKKESEAATTV